MNRTGVEVVDALLARLDADGVPYVLHEHAPSVTIANADASLDFPVERLLKTIAFRVKDRGWLLAGILGYAQLDYRRLSAAVGVPRDRIMRLEAHEVEEQLGYPLGGVAPIAPDAATRVLMDTGVRRWGTIYCGCGRPDRTLEIAPEDLARLAHAEFAPLAKKIVCEG